jgi:hypothetical protein
MRSYRFPTEDLSPKPPFFATSDMSDQSASSRFLTLFESALQDYENQTGMTLDKHPLAEQLNSCHSVESVMAVLEGQARAVSDFRGSDGRAMKSLKAAVSVLFMLSTNSVLGEAIGLVRQKSEMGVGRP